MQKWALAFAGLNPDPWLEEAKIIIGLLARRAGITIYEGERHIV